MTAIPRAASLDRYIETLASVKKPFTEEFAYFFEFIKIVKDLTGKKPQQLIIPSVEMQHMKK